MRGLQGLQRIISVKIYKEICEGHVHISVYLCVKFLIVFL